MAIYHEFTRDEILREFVRRKRLKEQVQLTMRVEGFDKQNAYLDDMSRFKAAQCSRRSGKSYGEGVSHIECALRYPASNQIYAALSLDSAATIIWDIFGELDDKYKLNAKFDQQKKIMKLPNNSKVRLFGLDASYREMKKILGGKLRKVTIDECGSMTVDVSKAVKQVIRPALTDLEPNSFLSLIGTCENIPNTYFEDVTNNRDEGISWSVHKWTAYDNPFMREQWAREIADITTANPLVVNSSWFKTHYLNEWCADDNLLILPLKPEMIVDCTPIADWSFSLGVDLGYKDATSFVVGAWNKNHPAAYIVEAYKKVGLDFTDVARHIHKLDKTYNFTQMICDGANLQGVQELNKRHNLRLKPSDKKDKHIFLKQLKDDFATGKIKLIKSRTGELQLEMKHLQWVDTDQQSEDPRCENHLIDALLYNWRMVLKHYLYKEPIKPPDRYSEEYMDLKADEYAKKVLNPDPLSLGGFES